MIVVDRPSRATDRPNQDRSAHGTDRPRHTTERRFVRRVGRGLAAGLLFGSLVGATVGLVIGLIAFRPGSAGMWMSVVAALVFGAGVGWFAGAMATLEEPDPGAEPMEQDEEPRPREGGHGSETTGAPG